MKGDAPLVDAGINVGWTTKTRCWPPETTLAELLEWWKQDGEDQQAITIRTGGKR